MQITILQKEVIEWQLIWSPLLCILPAVVCQQCLFPFSEFLKHDQVNQPVIFLSFCLFIILYRFKTLLANRPCGENTCIEISNVKFQIFQVVLLCFDKADIVSKCQPHVPLNIYVVFSFLRALCKLWILSYQLVMQYLYCGGTEALHIRNTDVMEVRSLVS